MQSKMDQLPIEPFTTIMSYLDLSDKLNCILVCRHWHQVLSSTNLFSSLSFGSRSWNEPTNFENFYKAVAVISKKKHVGSQVNNIKINGQLDFYLVLSLPKLFPNVKTLTLFDSYNNVPTDIPSQQEFAAEFKKWDQLERLCVTTTTTVYRLFPFVTYLSGSTTFINLTRLSVSINTLSPTIGSNNNDISMEPLIENIKNTPALKYLGLSGFELSLMDMETLHANAPQLQKLPLLYIQFAPPDKEVAYISAKGELRFNDMDSNIKEILKKARTKSGKLQLIVYIPLFENEQKNTPLQPVGSLQHLEIILEEHPRFRDNSHYKDTLLNGLLISTRNITV